MIPYLLFLGMEPVYGRENESNLMAPWPAIGFSHRMMSSGCDCEECTANDPDCRRCSWCDDIEFSEFDYSFSMDVRNFREIIKNIRHILKNMPTSFPLYGIYMRFTQKSNALMSKCWDRDCVHVEFVSVSRNRTEEDPRFGLGAYQAIAHSLVNYFDARPHYGKNGPSFHTKELLDTKYGDNLDKFRSLMKKYDANGLYMNKFGQRILGESNDQNINPEFKRCGLVDSCTNETKPEKGIEAWSISCEKNEDCAKNQTCETFDLNLSKPSSVKMCKDLYSNMTDPLVRIQEPLIDIFIYLEDVFNNLTDYINHTISK